MKSYKPKISNSAVAIRYALMSMCISSVSYSVIFDQLKDLISYDRASMLTVLFNVLSVGGMGLVSVFADRVENKHTGVRLAVLLTAIGYILPADFGIDLKVILLGLGSAVFHSFAASSILSRSGGKSRDIGLFIGGNAIGIAFVSLTPAFGHLFIPLLLMLAIPSDRYQNTPENEPKTHQNEPKMPQSVPFSPLPFVFLFLVYLLLSYEFSSFSFSWNVLPKTQLQLLLAVGLGRAIGGSISDKLGRIITAASSSIGTALIFLCSDGKYPSLLGLLLLSMSLAPTLTSFARLFPKNPALSFAVMTLAAYLGQALANLTDFGSITMLLICAVLVAVTVAAEMPYLSKEAKKDEAD